MTALGFPRQSAPPPLRDGATWDWIVTATRGGRGGYSRFGETGSRRVRAAHAQPVPCAGFPENDGFPSAFTAQVLRARPFHPNEVCREHRLCGWCRARE